MKEIEGCGWMIIPNNPRPHLTVREQQSNLWFHADKQLVIIHLLYENDVWHTMPIKFLPAWTLPSVATSCCSPPRLIGLKWGWLRELPPIVLRCRIDVHFWAQQLSFLFSTTDTQLSDTGTVTGKKNVTKRRSDRRGTLTLAVTEFILRGSNIQGFNCVL